MKEFMETNYHTHTPRCGHAYGTEREFIEEALKMNMKELGFADHAPIPYHDFKSGMRMGMEEAPGYVAILKELREEYKDRIQIWIGFEAEYLRDYYEEQMAAYEKLGIDYLILGQHFNESEQKGPYNANPTEDKKQLSDYVDVVIEAAGTGRYAYVAHPDILNFVGDDAYYEQEMTRLCESLKTLNIPLEINLIGISDHKNYPNPKFWEIAGRVQNPVILGMDAHSPDYVSVTSVKAYEKARKMVERYWLNLIPGLHMEEQYWAKRKEQ